MFGRQKRSQLRVISSLGLKKKNNSEEFENVNGHPAGRRSSCSHLNASGQNGVENMCTLLHDADVSGGGVSTLAVLDGVDEAVSKLVQGAQEVLFDEIHHAVVCREEKRVRRRQSVIGEFYITDISSFQPSLKKTSENSRKCHLRIEMLTNLWGPIISLCNSYIV